MGGRPNFAAYEPSGVKKPEVRLAELMQREMQFEVSPNLLRLFLLAHFNKVSMLAHAIHDKAAADG